MELTFDLIEVAVDAPLYQTLTYRRPPDMKLRRGAVVEVPLGKRRATGIIMGPADDPVKDIEFKPLFGTIDEAPISDARLSWLEWLSDYYIHPIGQVTALSLPPLARENARSRQRKTEIAQLTPLNGEPKPTLHTLTDEQRAVLDHIPLNSGFSAHLIHGVTGSGKTEIYIKMFEEILAQGKQGLLLVPEISLTPQLINRFVERLGEDVGVIHSHLTPREKTNQWYAMTDEKKKVLIGARSALFCPIPKLGLIVLDEEHEPSFKQDEKLKYHARDAAVVLARKLEIPVVMGSATPSLESWYNAQRGKYVLHSLKSRVENRLMPTVEIIDLKREGLELENDWLSPELKAALTDQLQRGEQSALFLNRRGAAQAVLCTSCGEDIECPNCSVSLTLHGKTSLVCHYCNYYITLPELCPSCGSGEPKPIGFGTEQIENDIQKIFPGTRTLRMDRDEINTREELEEAISTIEKGEIDVLIGTQMIAKGLDFPKLTLVGVVLADVALHLPDFRAGERAFHLLTQVAGRSGRHINDRAGRVIVQTYNPDHPSVQFASTHDFVNFATHELQFREALRYPPHARLAVLRLNGMSQERVVRMAKVLMDRAQALRVHHPAYKDIELLGPAPSPIGRLRNKFRWQILAKGPNPLQLSAFCRQLTSKQTGSKPA